MLSTTQTAKTVFTFVFICLDMGAANAIEEPSTRFTTFSQLPSTVIAVAGDGLGYKESSWNLLGSAPIESMSWETNKDNVNNFIENARSIGISGEEVWDCYVNHYADYWWSELVQDGIDNPWRALGYDESMWDGGNAPEVEDKYWDELSAAERQAAEQLCYREEIWNEIPLNFWAPEVTSAPVGSVGSPSASPITSAPTSLQVVIEPLFRFVEWSKLDSGRKESALNDLNYREDTWNVVGTAELETLSFQTINTIAPTQSGALKSLGFNGLSWDCYMNHFAGYSWDSLPPFASSAFTILGWNAEMWRGAGVPETESKDWSDLTTAEQEAGKASCYSELTWDQVPLTETALWFRGGTISTIEDNGTDGQESAATPYVSTFVLVVATSAFFFFW